MHRRRFIEASLGSLALVATGASTARSSGTSRPPPAYPDALEGQVALAGDLLPSGRSIRSNLESVSWDHVAARLQAAMERLLGPNPWARLFRPSDTVAIKINGLAAGHLSPRRELIGAITASLQSAGLAPGQIIVFERTGRELERCGFTRQTGPGAVRIYGTDDLRGGGYTSRIEHSGSVGSLLSRILTDYATALINVGVLKDHDLAGVSAGMKNLYGLIHNPNRYHDHSCDPYVADVAALPSVRAKLRLTIIDALLGQAHGGPAFREQWIWPQDRLLVGCDPVAVDATAAALITARRQEIGLPSLVEAGRAPSWLYTASEMGLGRAEDIHQLEV